MKITSGLPSICFACSMEMRGTSTEVVAAAGQLKEITTGRAIKKPVIAKKIRMIMVTALVIHL